MHAAKFHARNHTLQGLLATSAILGALALTSSPAHAWGWDWSWGNSIKGSGNVVTSTRALTGVQGIALEIPADVKLVQGPNESVVLETDDNIAPLVETVVESGQLFIRMGNRGDSVQTKTLRMTVTAPHFTVLSVAGSGNIQADALQTAKLKTNISGSGDIRLQKLHVGELSIAISGSGDFEASGHAEAMKVSIAGSGDIRTKGLEAKQVKVSIAGSGDAAVWATEVLHVSIAGSGDVQYYGDAAASQSIAGSGSVRRVASKP